MRRAGRHVRRVFEERTHNDAFCSSRGCEVEQCEERACGTELPAGPGGPCRRGAASFRGAAREAARGLRGPEPERSTVQGRQLVRDGAVQDGRLPVHGKGDGGHG